MKLRAAMVGVLIGVGLGMTQAQEAVKWTEFTSKEGRFKCLMPGTPKETKNNIPGPKGTMIEQKMFLVDGGSKAYLITYLDTAGFNNAEEEKKALKDSRDATAAGLKGKVLQSKELKLADKYLGLEFQCEAPAAKGVYRSRIFLVGKRFYQVVVVGPADLVTSKESDRYLDSFTLID